MAVASAYGHTAAVWRRTVCATNLKRQLLTMLAHLRDRLPGSTGGLLPRQLHNRPAATRVVVAFGREHERGRRRRHHHQRGEAAIVMGGAIGIVRMPKVRTDVRRLGRRRRGRRYRRRRRCVAHAPSRLAAGTRERPRVWTGACRFRDLLVCGSTCHVVSNLAVCAASVRRAGLATLPLITSHRA